MVSIAKKSKHINRSKRSEAKAMTRTEMVQKMLIDQKTIRDAIQNGIPLKELEKKHGFKFAPLPNIKN